jgi:hypothetical protein
VVHAVHGEHDVAVVVVEKVLVGHAVQVPALIYCPAVQVWEAEKTASAITTKSLS